MGINHEKLLAQLLNTDANERLEGIRFLLEDKYTQKQNLSPEIIKVLDQIACSDDDAIIRNLAKRLLGRDEYLDLYNPLNVTVTPAKSKIPAETPKLTSNTLITPDEARRKKYRTWGWILTILGGLILLPSIFFLIAAIECFRTNCVPGMDMMGVLGIAVVGTVGLSIGLTLFILGIWFLFSTEEENHKIWGWIFSIVGGMFVLWGIFCILKGVFAVVMEKSNILFYCVVSWGVLGLVTGILLFIQGLRIFSTWKKPLANPKRVDNTS